MDEILTPEQVANYRCQWADNTVLLPVNQFHKLCGGYVKLWEQLAETRQQLINEQVRGVLDSPHAVALNKPQPPPGVGVGDITELVIADLMARRRVGIARYGTTLQAWNGRDALIDAYQEVLDLAQYLRQAIEERAGEAINDEQ
mgnify:CR=1 FL=1